MDLLNENKLNWNEEYSTLVVYDDFVKNAMIYEIEKCQRHLDENGNVILSYNGRVNFVVTKSNFYYDSSIGFFNQFGIENFYRSIILNKMIKDNFPEFRNLLPVNRYLGNYPNG